MSCLSRQAEELFCLPYCFEINNYMKLFILFYPDQMAHDKCRKVNVGTMLDDTDRSSATTHHTTLCTASEQHNNGTHLQSNTELHSNTQLHNTQLHSNTQLHNTQLHNTQLHNTQLPSHSAPTPREHDEPVKRSRGNLVSSSSDLRRSSSTCFSGRQLTRSYSNSSQLTPYSKTYSASRVTSGCHDITRANSTDPIVRSSSQLLPYSCLKNSSLSLHYLPKSISVEKVNHQNPRLPSLQTVEREGLTLLTNGSSRSSSSKSGIIHNSNFLHPDQHLIMATDSSFNRCRYGRIGKVHESQTSVASLPSIDYSAKSSQTPSTCQQSAMISKTSQQKIPSVEVSLRALPNSESDCTLSVPRSHRKVARSRGKISNRSLTLQCSHWGSLVRP